MAAPRATATFSGQLTPADAKTLRSYELDVPPGSAALRLELRFDPIYSLDVASNRARVRAAIEEYLGERADPAHIEQQLARHEFAVTIERMRNHLNFNLYDPAWRFRGRWDFTNRGGPSRLAVRGSSPGFVDGPLPPGRWHLVLEVHLIATARCDYQLIAEALQSPPPAEASVPATTAVDADRGRALVPPRAGWLVGEMHSHTTHSDGRHSVPGLAARARAAGLDFVALTDHNTTSGHGEAAACDDLLVLPGEEVTTFDGHFCLYGVDRTVPWHLRGQRRSMAEIADEIRGEGALFSVAHPFQIGMPVCAGCRWSGGDPPPDRIDLLEVWSGCSAERGVEIERALALWDRLWDQGHRPVGIAARDWHGRAQVDTEGRHFARTVVRAATPTRAALMAGLRAGAVYLSVGPHVELRAVRGSAQAGLGGTLAGRGDAVLSVRLWGPRLSAAELRLLHGGREVALRAAPAAEPISLPMTSAGRYRVELRGPAGEPLLVTNHILVE